MSNASQEVPEPFTEEEEREEEQRLMDAAFADIDTVPLSGKQIELTQRWLADQEEQRVSDIAGFLPDEMQDIILEPPGVPVFSFTLEAKIDRILALLEAQEKAACIHLNTTTATNGDRICDQCGTILWIARQE